MEFNFARPLSVSLHFFLFHITELTTMRCETKKMYRQNKLIVLLVNVSKILSAAAYQMGILVECSEFKAATIRKPFVWQRKNGARDKQDATAMALHKMCAITKLFGKRQTLALVELNDLYFLFRFFLFGRHKKICIFLQM